MFSIMTDNDHITLSQNVNLKKPLLVRSKLVRSTVLWPMASGDDTMWNNDGRMRNDDATSYSIIATCRLSLGIRIIIFIEQCHVDVTAVAVRSFAGLLFWSLPFLTGLKLVSVW